MKVVLEQVIILGLLIFVGYLAKERNIISKSTSDDLMKILTKISLPALIVVSFNFDYSKDLEKNLYSMLVYSSLAFLLSIVLSNLLYRNLPREKKYIMIFSGVFTNCAFMGIPLVMALYGQVGVLYSSIYMIPFHVLTWTYGNSILGEDKFDFKKIILNPSIIGVIIGLFIFFTGLRLPYIISKPLDYLASLTSPISMLVLGVKVSEIDLIKLFKSKEAYLVSLIRLVLIPLVNILIFKNFPLDPVVYKTLILLQSLPSAVLLLILTGTNGGDENLAAELTVLSHLLGLITIPFILSLI